MKKFKQFRAEQQYITEVGPFASAMMVAMGAAGLGFAGFKLFKKGKAAIKGYRETKKEIAQILNIDQELPPYTKITIFRT